MFIMQREAARLKTKYGPWAIVTGASDGIGRDFAVRAAEAGLNVVLVARRGAVLDTLARELRERCGVETRVCALDLGAAGACERLGESTADIDVGLLVAAAGYGTSGRFIENAIEEELAMLDVNCRAVVELTHLFGKRFAARGRGGVVLLSSLVAFQGVPMAANYAATKAYIQALAEGIRSEVRPRGVDVIACAPGPIQSGFGARANMKMGMAGRADMVARETLRALGRRGIVPPGFLSKFLEFSLALLPRWGRVRMMSLVMGGMTKHQR